MPTAKQHALRSSAYVQFLVLFIYLFSLNPASAQKICSDGLLCIDQGWTEQDRTFWYTTGQGSRLLPLDWMLALERAQGDDAAPEQFLSPANVKRLGYLPNPKSTSNPYGLPLGFVVDHNPSRSADLMCDVFPATCENRTMRKPWIGMTCAACHSNDLTYKDKRFRVEGAATLADFQGLEEELLAALKATVADTQRFDRFARAVLETDMTVDSRAELKSQLNEQIAWQSKLEEKNKSSVRYGNGRLDAQGHILNKVALAIENTGQPTDIHADAPASYPFVWNISQQDKIQWNGIANNLLKITLFGLETDVGALVRNTSEVIGVFAHIEVNRGSARRGYDSSIRIDNLIDLERHIAKLKSPRWPEKLHDATTGKDVDVLPPIDWEKAQRGKELFDRFKCANCHHPLAWDDLESPAHEKMDPIQDQLTDIFLACNTFLHSSKSGNLQGQKVFAFTGDKIGSQAFTRDLLVNSTVGTVMGKLDQLAGSVFEGIFQRGAGESRDFGIGTAKIEYLPGVTSPEKKRQAETCLNTRHELLAYKARPLNGIWATAPYLHNGSVPTLYDLLLPPKLRNTQTEGVILPDPSGPTRPEVFSVGLREFDPVKVGFISNADAQGAPFIFRVRDEATGEPIPGNYNSGHNYGTGQLTDEQRFELVEYLKTL